MKISIIPIDKTVVIDGIGFGDLIYSIDSNIHAVQWKDTKGHIEFVENSDGSRPLNQEITDISPYQSAIDAWNIAKDEWDKFQIPVTTI